ncbi:MAG TPA: hypothetical protein DIT01_10400 [Lentisphaeria bacterium]|jgi:phosphoserine phosphatase|nr:hypothetical protein [Lentisphaeria bacterium]|tara:strand:+ start:374 stop:1045 length:672 start_codon:yes stop_codon:yes gene_type:complete
MSRSRLSPAMQYKLICFDLDGTLVDDTVYIWKTLHDAFDVPKDQRRRHYEDYLNGRITYAQWFEADIDAWHERGKRRNDLLAVIRQLSLMPGAIETLDTLRQQGYKLAIISGSIDIVIDTLLGTDHFDDVFVNRIFFDDAGNITGGEPTPYDMEHKATGLRVIAERESLQLEECVFIGDNENDVHIAEIAGLSIAFNSKSPRLDEIADVVIEKKDLREVLQYL